MNAINCTLVPVNLNDASILTKLRVFGIFAPDEDKMIMYGRSGGRSEMHYCISHVEARFDEDSLAALDSEEASDSTKKAIKTQYLKICSFAFLFGIGKDCVRDKNNRLIPIDLTVQNQHNILENKNGTYSPHLVSEITDVVYDHLDKLKNYEIITSDQKWELISKYQEQLSHDDLILKEPEFGTCCCCGGPCNPCSQTCGACPRNGRLIWDYIDHIDEVIDAVNDSECTNELDTFHYNNEQVYLLKDVIKRYKNQFKGCLNPKKAIMTKNFPHYIVSKHKKQWVLCTNVKERKARILISVDWVRANLESN